MAFNPPPKGTSGRRYFSDVFRRFRTPRSPLSEQQIDKIVRWLHERDDDGSNNEAANDLVWVDGLLHVDGEGTITYGSLCSVRAELVHTSLAEQRRIAAVKRATEERELHARVEAAYQRQLAARRASYAEQLAKKTEDAASRTAPRTQGLDPAKRQEPTSAALRLAFLRIALEIAQLGGEKGEAWIVESVAGAQKLLMGMRDRDQHYQDDYQMLARLSPVVLDAWKRAVAMYRRQKRAT